MRTSGWFLLLSLLIVSCTRKKTELAWEVNFPVIGSLSSPRSADLNGDGVLDLVIGAGRNEYQYSKQGVLALDGATGALLWEQEADDQVYGSPTFCDINGDGTPDVFIGGRSPYLRALDGKNGRVIWAYNHEQYANHPVLKYARFSFQNSVLVPDQNGDGVDDLFIVNGGNPKAPPYDESDRYPGVLMVFDARTGSILAADTVPDGKESYMAPLCFRQPGASDHTIVFGTGGETIDGRLYVTTLSDLMKNNVSSATAVVAETGHGFIAPPVAVDITGDGFLDIIAISHASTVTAIEGKTLQPVWQRKIEGTECSNSFAVGHFAGGDDTPDLFTFVSKGEWPNNTGTIEVMLNGKNGEIAFTRELGCTGFSSPVVYDLNGDGFDEAIISINEFDCSLGFVEAMIPKIENRLLAVDFRRGSIMPIDEAQGFKNIFTTPWIGDIDDDGYLDIVHCQYYSRGGLLVFLGMRVRRISTNIKAKQQPVWGAYRGSAGNGVFEEAGRSR
jgi:outer membrane protein assembly factor BamB